jgi:hypothetical protein
MLSTLPFWIAAVYRMGVEERSLAEVEACRWACGLTVRTPWSSIIMWP